MQNLFNRIPLSLLLVLCFTLGLAPFVPEPHLLEKLRMLVSGELKRPIDIFDLLLHGTPWLVLILKLSLLSRRAGKGEFNE
ncbi:MAG: RND transporter [Gammaproteobacteria bacterium]|nr:RND transporter [Gammaproteobacteria bacterium]